MTNTNSSNSPTSKPSGHSWTDAIVGIFLRSNLPIILIVLAVAAGITALQVTPREEDPQIVVPLADVHVSFPGHSAHEVEQLAATPLERLLYEIDGVEYVYTMSREGHAIVTVRFYVGEDRERSLVKLYKRIDEHLELVPPGVEGWVVKPVEIDDVPIITLTLRSDTADTHLMRRVAEEAAARLARIGDVSRVTLTGGEPRAINIYLLRDRLEARGLSPLEVEHALKGANVTLSVGSFERGDREFRVEAGRAFVDASELAELVVGVENDALIQLKDVARIVDGADEVETYTRHAFGPARGFADRPGSPGSLIGGGAGLPGDPVPAVTIALAKKKGTNAVAVADEILAMTAVLKQGVIPDDIEVVITRNSGQTANDKVNELTESLVVAVFIVIALLTLGLGWREALIVALAVPIVFGMTLALNLLFGYTINRVTLFALILSIGLLVDDPIVDVENITRHFKMHGKATREIVLGAISEIRPPLISATLAVIASFLPLFFISGMMGPYMRPLAVNVPIAMFMSLVVAFTITPWLGYHLLKGRYKGVAPPPPGHDPDDLDADALRSSLLYRFFYPLMAPILSSRRRAWGFLLVFVVLTGAAATLAATRSVPLKMLPFDNKNELLLLLDYDEGTTLERSDAGVREFESFLAGVEEVTDFTSYVGTSSPMDFNGMVRHYYLRQGQNVAEIRVNLVGKRSRATQSHTIGLRLRPELTEIAERVGANLKLVELPPGPPVIATLVAEVTGRPDSSYDDLVAAAGVVRRRLEAEPAVVDVDDSVEAEQQKLVFVTDKEKAALTGITVAEIARTLELALAGMDVGVLRVAAERHPLGVKLRLPRAARSSMDELSRLQVKGRSGVLAPLNELGRFEETTVDRTLYHKNLERIVYVFAEVAGRPPADVVLDVQADRSDTAIAGGVADATPIPVGERTFFDNGGGIAWSVPEEIDVGFAGEGEWNITLDVFRDLGLAFAAALLAIYVLLVAQTGSFMVPVVVMLAIPLTILGIMPGFWLLNAAFSGQVGGFADPIFFTATGMIGMIALAGIVTRDSIILVDFIHLSLAKGRTLFDAIMESRVVRLRPILLTSATAMLSAAPITIDPIFSGLAWALIFGLFASTVFTLFVIPVTYWLLYEKKHRSARTSAACVSDASTSN